MPSPTPFHSRTSALCKSYSWKQWSGYYAVTNYEVIHDLEYMAIRQAAGLLDVTPLCKYDIRGPGASDLVEWIFPRSFRKFAVGRIAYTPWCDSDGHVLDDGTVSRMAPDWWRVTSADPARRWFEDCAQGFDVTIDDVTESMAALALQGPTSRAILKQVTEGIDFDKLKFFRLARGTIGGIDVVVSRTGYTGDLGYEIWTENAGAETLWDTLMEGGKNYGIRPIGLMALDTSRIEAGFILKGVDYIGAKSSRIASQRYTPYEIGLGWCVNLKKPRFVGRDAVRKSVQSGLKRQIVGLDIDWPTLESLYDSMGLPPGVPGHAWRDCIPVYDARGNWVGKATSGCWSPIVKKNLALATLEAAHTRPGSLVQIEWTIEGRRTSIPATVTATPFFNPERKVA